MITDLLLDLIEGAYTFLMTALPTISFDPVALFGGALGHLGDLNYFLPIQELAAAVLAALVLFPAFMGMTLLAWLIALIRGGSSRG